jgi:hypothetical protein
MITRTLLFTLNAVPVPPINNTHATGPLTKGINTNIFRRFLGRKPLGILGGNGIPNTNGVVQTQLRIVTYVTLVQPFKGFECMTHERIDPFSEW